MGREEIMKRYRKPRAKSGQLKAQWGKLPHEEPDLCFAWGDGVPHCDAALLQGFLAQKYVKPGTFEFGDSFLEELEKRGYDIKTLKFSISKKDT
jgi:hypothetical protein